MNAPTDVLSFGPFRVYARERRLEREGQNVKIGSRALDILIALTDRAGEVVSKEALTARVWPDTAVEDSALRVHIAGLRKALGDGVAGARYITNVPGRGYSFVAHLARSATVARPVEAPRAALDQGPKLPCRLDRIVGRDAAIRDLSEQVLAKRFVSVVGPGGLGKTTVAVAVAHALLPNFEGDACFVDLGSINDPRHVALSVASTLGLQTHTDDIAASLIAFLRDRRTLLVLDSCEHVMDSVAPLAERLSRDAIGVHIIATSRESLRVEGEHVHRMAPLDVPPDRDDVSATDALTFPAVQLFVERATAGGARFSLTDIDAPIVAGICRRLDGIALAIEFAAGRVDAYGIRGTASLLENRFKLLWHGRRTALPRHQTLSASLDWSYNLLTELERALLRALSIFVGTFSLEGAAAVAGDVDAERAVHTLGSLVDKSLVATSSSGGADEVRYRLLDTVRGYAQAKLDEAGERAAVAARHAAHLCSALEEENRVIDGARVRSLAEHAGNVRAALHWCFSNGGDAPLGTRLAAAAGTMFTKLSLLRECSVWMETALAALDDVHRGTPRELNLQAALAVAAMFTRGNGPEVRAALTRALSLADELDDPHEQLRLLGALNLLTTRTGEWREALSIGEQSERIAARLHHDHAARLLAEWMTGTAHHLLGNHAEAEKLCRPALNPAPTSRSATMLSFGFDHRIRALVVLGRSLWLLGRAEEALRVAALTVREAATMGQPTTVAISLVWTFHVYLWSGELDTAADIVDRLVEHTEKHSLGPYYHVGLGLRGELAVRNGDFAGIDGLRRATETLHGGRHDLLQTVFETAMAQGLASNGRHAEALATIDRAIALTDRNGRASFDLPEMLRVKGHLLSTMPSPSEDEGDRCLRDALDRAKQQNALAWELRAAMTLADLRSRKGRIVEARRLLSDTYHRFTEGFQTADLLEAKRLLAVF